LTALVPFRSYILNRLFDEKDTAFLDPTSESQEEHAAEQRAIHMALRNDSFDAEDALHVPNRADFHPESFKNTKGTMMHDHDKVQNEHQDIGQRKEELLVKQDDAAKSDANLVVDMAVGSDSNDIELTDAGHLHVN
jgi:hypothetical protein